MPNSSTSGPVVRASTWLDRALSHGESVQAERPQMTDADRSECAVILNSAFRRLSLGVAGPELEFHEPVAWHSARLLATACWRLVADTQSEPLALSPVTPRSASEHLSADVTLRFLPAVYHRAVARGMTDLAEELAAVLRGVPLAGVLANMPAGPSVDLELGGHSGLQLLYAERLLRTNQAAWVPDGGSTREWAERVFAERGRILPQSVERNEVAGE